MRQNQIINLTFNMGIQRELDVVYLTINHFSRSPNPKKFTIFATYRFYGILQYSYVFQFWLSLIQTRTGNESRKYAFLQMDLRYIKP